MLTYLQKYVLTFFLASHACQVAKRQLCCCVSLPALSRNIPVFVISFLEIQKIFTATLTDSHIFSHLWHLSTYLSIYIDPSIHPSICLSVYLSACLPVYLSIYVSVSLSVYLSICRSYSARLPWNLEVESWKTKLFCETSFKFGSWQHQNCSISARLPQFLKLATSKNKEQFCETSGKNEKLSAELTASCQCVLWLFHSICLKFCAGHEKVRPGHMKCCICHAKSP